MAIKGQLTGMAGMYFVAAELSMRGYIVAPTSRNAQGVDLLVSNADGTIAIPIQVKTNSSSNKFWLLGEKCLHLKSENLFYILVNLKRPENEYFIVPNENIVEGIIEEKSKKPRAETENPSVWYSFPLGKAAQYKDQWYRLEAVLNRSDSRTGV